MSAPDDGGPAFPASMAVGPAGDVYRSDDSIGHSGMTLRDYFAAAALQGLIRHPDAVGENEDVIASWAYAAADAMLKVKKETQ